MDFKKSYRTPKFPAEPKNDLVFGLRAVEETLKSGKEIEKIYFDKGQGNLTELIREAKALNIPHAFVPVEKLNQFTRKNHQGVVALISPIQYVNFENLLIELFETGEPPLILVLDRITDVRNFGAICRSAECMGVHAVVIPAKGAAQINADALKTSAGALQHIAVCREDNLKNTLRYMRDSGLKIIACTEKKGDYLHKIDFTEPTAVIMGSEEDGISEEYLKLADARASIPMTGKINSLNVSVATGVILYEIVRQRLQR